MSIMLISLNHFYNWTTYTLVMLVQYFKCNNDGYRQKGELLKGNRIYDYTCTVILFSGCRSHHLDWEPNFHCPGILVTLVFKTKEL